jgi:hypothetical protein
MFDSIVFEFVSMCDGILGQSRSSLFQSFVFGYVSFVLLDCFILVVDCFTRAVDCFIRVVDCFILVVDCFICVVGCFILVVDVLCAGGQTRKPGDARADNASSGQHVHKLAID